MIPVAPWGKFADGDSHHLIHHCADVAACFEALASLSVVRDRLENAARESLSSNQIARLAVLAFLHDCGKLHPGFQARGWPDGIWNDCPHGHVQEGAAIFAAGSLGQIARNLHIESLGAWCVDRNLLFAVLAHHGYPFELGPGAEKRWRSVRQCNYDPVAASAEMGAMISMWFPEAFKQDSARLPQTSEFQHLLCGIVSLADWLGSTQDIFEFVPVLDPHYMNCARRKAQSALKQVGVDVIDLRLPIKGNTEFERLTGGLSPRPLQRLVGGFPLTELLLILEAETGSGKTEAAVWRFARLFEAGQVDGLYFALPTRAAAIQIHRRVNDLMKNLFGEAAPEVVLAVPGYLKAGEAEGRKLPDWKVRWDDDGGESERKLLSRWAAENVKRALAATVAVGTVDQAMLAALQVKHANLRAAALSRSLLVVDEVHASDRYMTEVQKHLLDTHLGYGGHAMLMSATLGSAARTRWQSGNDDPSFDEAVLAPYPAVWGKGPKTLFAGTQTGQKTVAMKPVPTMAADTVARLSVDAAQGNARVLVIRNTVKEAIAAFQAVLEKGAGDLLMRVAGGPALHHGRFAPEDRKLLDAAAEAALSPKGRLPGGCIVIGTQTLEQSLDIDADILITDLCPVDVLLQRIGRLHRHELDRPSGFENAQCRVLLPERGLEWLLEPEPNFCNGLGAWKKAGVLNGIYRDVAGLELTRRLIETHPEWTIPAMNRLLVESATHPEQVDKLLGELGPAWNTYWYEVYGKDVADAGAAKNVALQIDTKFAEVQFPSNDEKIRTRLGAEGACIEFTEPVIGPFGVEISGVTLPAHWSRGIDSSEAATPLFEADTFRFSSGEVDFRYDRLGLDREVNQSEIS